MSLRIAAILVTVFTFYTAQSSEIKSPSDAQVYLEHFGYLRFPNKDGNEASSSQSQATRRLEGSKHLRNETMFKETLAVFQQYAGLQQTGRFDNATKMMMNKPRCGMSERMELTENKWISRSRLTHKIPRRRRWKTSRIFYKITKYPEINGSGLHPTTIRKEIRRAFELWEKVANIRCIELPANSRKPAEIDISFVVKEHGDGTAFGDTSIGNAVAHAFFPDHHRFEGDIHYNEENTWTSEFETVKLNSVSSGVNLYQTSAHEIGHALGLDHSIFPESVMHMIVHSELEENFKLHEDDIKGIQNLYGRRRQHGQRRLINRSRSHVQQSSSEDVDSYSERMNDRIEFPSPGITTQKSVVEIEENAVSSTDNDNETPLETTLDSFWECFGLSYESQSSKKISDCYTRNVLNFLYSLNL